MYWPSRQYEFVVPPSMQLCHLSTSEQCKQSPNTSGALAQHSTAQHSTAARSGADWYFATTGFVEKFVGNVCHSSCGNESHGNNIHTTDIDLIVAPVTWILFGPLCCHRWCWRQRWERIQSSSRYGVQRRWITGWTHVAMSTWMLWHVKPWLELCKKFATDPATNSSTTNQPTSTNNDHDNVHTRKYLLA